MVVFLSESLFLRCSSLLGAQGPAEGFGEGVSQWERGFRETSWAARSEGPTAGRAGLARGLNAGGQGEGLLSPHSANGGT